MVRHGGSRRAALASLLPRAAAVVSRSPSQSRFFFLGSRRQRWNGPAGLALIRATPRGAAHLPFSSTRPSRSSLLISRPSPLSRVATFSLCFTLAWTVGALLLRALRGQPSVSRASTVPRSPCSSFDETRAPPPSSPSPLDHLRVERPLVRRPRSQAAGWTRPRTLADPTCRVGRRRHRQPRRSWCVAPCAASPL